MGPIQKFKKTMKQTRSKGLSLPRENNFKDFPPIV